MSASPCTQAVILVGGEGTRLRPITSTLPKPAAPVVCRPFITYILENLARYGVSRVIFSTGYLAAAIEAVVHDGADYGLRVDYAIEDEPLGTAGAIRNCESLLDDGPFLALNGDVLTDVDLDALRAVHAEASAQATIYLTPVEDPSRYGLVITGEGGRVRQFVEKPKPEEVSTSALINAGFYVLEPAVLDLIPAGQAFSIERGVFPVLAQRGTMYAYASDCYWRDIGTPESYLAANFDVLQGAVRSKTAERLGRGCLFQSASAAVASSARVVPPVYLDDDVRVGEHAVVGPQAVVGAGSSIGAGASVVESVLQEGVQVGEEARLNHTVLVRRTVLGRRTRVWDAILGEGCRIGDDNSLGRGLCLAPETVIPDGRLFYQEIGDGASGA